MCDYDCANCTLEFCVGINIETATQALEELKAGNYKTIDEILDGLKNDS